MNNNIIMHINYCEQGQTFPDLCRKAADWGFDGIEFRSRNLQKEQSMEEYLDLIARSVNHVGLKEVVFGYPSPNMMLPDADARKAEIETGLEFYKRAAELFKPKLRVCNAFTGSLLNPDNQVSRKAYAKQGSFIATDDQWKWAVEGYKIVGDQVAKLGLKLAYETHMCYLHDVAPAVKKLVDRINCPAIGVNMDFGNMICFDRHPTLRETLALLEKKIFYVHLQNSIPLPDGKRRATALADGEINHREYLSVLKEMAYTGPICVEAPRKGDREWYAQQDLAYIRSVMTDLE